VTEVEATGRDPCKAGSITSPVAVDMACYFGGPSWLGDASLGVCAYPCVTRQYDSGKVCSEEDLKVSIYTAWQFPGPRLLRGACSQEVRPGALGTAGWPVLPLLRPAGAAVGPLRVHAGAGDDSRSPCAATEVATRAMLKQRRRRVQYRSCTQS
jgi:hypothetical protein